MREVEKMHEARDEPGTDREKLSLSQIMIATNLNGEIVKLRYVPKIQRIGAQEVPLLFSLHVVSERDACWHGWWHRSELSNRQNKIQASIPLGRGKMDGLAMGRGVDGSCRPSDQIAI